MDKAWLYSNAGIWQPAIEPVDSWIDQVDSVSVDLIAAVSCGTSFASSMYGLTKRPIGLIPCALGGTSMDQWARPAVIDRTTLYGNMIVRIQEAAILGSIRGIIYYQGEQEAMLLADVNAWPAKFTQWCADVRTDTGIPDLPIVMTVIGPNPNVFGFDFWDVMVAVQQQMVLPDNCARVSASDLQFQVSDTIHMTTAALVTLGQRYANAFHIELGV